MTKPFLPRQVALAGFAVCTLLTATPVLSEDEREDSATGWSTDLGVAILSNPEFQGSSRYDIQAFPYFDVRYSDEKGEKYFFNVPQGLGAYLFRQRSDDGLSTRVFAAVAPAFADRDPDRIDGLETFGTGVQARLGWQAERGPFAVSAVAGKELGASHEGLTIDLSANFRARFGRGSFLTVGPTVRWGDSTYMQNLYGVTDIESINTGLTAFRASSGIESAGFQGLVSVPVSARWRLTTVLQVSRLLGDSADSSLTSEPNQAFFLTALTRRF
ncbi:MAG: MipA/OmpV family protein [Pseudomonadota bacterium]